MKTAVMQPYIFPYIGYWQLINAVDNFVLLDDVNFIMRGWINRNNILVNNQAHLFSIPLKKPSQNKLINETELNFDSSSRESFLRTIELSYKKAPFFEDVFPIIKDIILNKEADLTQFLLYSFERLSEYMGIDTKFYISSKLPKDNSLKAEDRIVEICKKLQTTMYINLPGGKGLYNPDRFKIEGMQLRFIEPNLSNIEYPQFSENFIANLSILDIIMFNDKGKIKNFLNDYSLIG